MALGSGRRSACNDGPRSDRGRSGRIGCRTAPSSTACPSSTFAGMPHCTDWIRITQPVCQSQNGNWSPGIVKASRPAQCAPAARNRPAQAGGVWGCGIGRGGASRAATGISAFPGSYDTPTAAQSVWDSGDGHRCKTLLVSSPRHAGTCPSRSCRNSRGQPPSPRPSHPARKRRRPDRPRSRRKSRK